MGSEESKQVDNDGNNNINNVVIAQPVEINHPDIGICIYVITVVLIIQLIMNLYNIHQRRLKKKYRSPVQMQNL